MRSKRLAAKDPLSTANLRQIMNTGCKRSHKEDMDSEDLIRT